MPWNPEIYNKFKDIRFKPFVDLMELIEPAASGNAIDLGCGTGEQSIFLAEKFKELNFLGVDSSAEMLLKSKAFETENLHFQQATIEGIANSDKKWDLVFSNAALQWSDHHEVLFPKLIDSLNSGGQFAVQMPVQKENTLNKLLYEVADEEPFKSYLKGWKRDSPVLSMDQYAQIMFDGNLENIQVMTKVYPIIAQDHDALYDFISGSALIPYMEFLEEDQQKFFTKTFKEKVAANFPKLPAIYAFKRIFLYGVKA
ncbi:methyltransferase domain-containing protein [Flavobacterium sp. LC2016-01]|uniref:methyltransferase domain-containing protein n=1 Tax=Flavobacterium sp. LC2016-01 TaxID=2675876 RepID=UPI0012BA836B|nr:methyltransferase domain-containing protein [Flavobacterium sp. LC2016-01]MTH16561.1 methyltransferase domain-containing protein [Flavobacterium sp. LC2016-01]